jgi:hypothetical protein
MGLSAGCDDFVSGDLQSLIDDDLVSFYCGLGAKRERRR